MTSITGPQELEQYLKELPIVLVQFGSERCLPCKSLQNKLLVWNQSHPQIFYIYVPAEEQPALCAQLGVFTVPTIFVYVESRLTIRESGYFSLEHLLEQVHRYEALLLSEIS